MDKLRSQPQTVDAEEWYDACVLASKLLDFFWPEEQAKMELPLYKEAIRHWNAVEPRDWFTYFTSKEHAKYLFAHPQYQVPRRHEHYGIRNARKSSV